MKNLFIYAAVIAATMGSMTACSDFLDVKPPQINRNRILYRKKVLLSC